MKKINVLILSILSIFLLSLSLTSCYVSNPAPLEDVIGTYVLKNYTRSYVETNEDGSETTTTTHDLIKEKEITAYLIINEDGNGYYVYKDKETTLSCTVVKVSFSYSMEDETLVSSISYTDGLSSNGDGYPGKGRETLGVNFKTFSKQLNYSYPKVFNRKYSQSVTYERKSSDTDLKYVNKKLSVNLTYNRYELNGLNGVFYSEWTGGHYDYLVVDINSKSLKGSVYYKLPNGLPQEVKNEDLRITTSKDEFGTETTSISIGDFTFKRTTGTYLSPYLSYECGVDLILLYPSSETVDEAISHLLSLLEN